MSIKTNLKSMLINDLFGNKDNYVKSIKQIRTKVHDKNKIISITLQMRRHFTQPVYLCLLSIGWLELFRPNNCLPDCTYYLPIRSILTRCNGFLNFIQFVALYLLPIIHSNSDRNILSASVSFVKSS